MADIKKKRMKKKRFWFTAIILILIVIPTCVGLYHYFKSMPPGISFEGEMHNISGLEFLYDLTYENSDGDVIYDQKIFNEIYSMIDEAEDFLVIDMFLFNDDYDHDNPELGFPPLSKKLAQALIDKKNEHPEMDIVFITDPLNTFYGTYEPDHFEAMKEAGIHLFNTDLSELRDSNPLYTSVYRSYLQWSGTSEDSWLKNALRPAGPEVNIRSYLSLLNFKANHRKIVINEKEGLVTSANPHDASTYHSNVGFKVEGNILNEMLASERSVLNMAGVDTSMFDHFNIRSSDEQGPYQVQLVTEQKVKDNMLQRINDTSAGDHIKLGMFYLSDRDIIEALKNALDRDVNLQMVLDVNQDAFGNEKNGIPNRPVAAEFMKMENSPEIRWYESHGEQYHAKFIMIEQGEDVFVTAGSSNFTKRNLNDYNLETNIIVEGQQDEEIFNEISSYYDRIWENQNGIYTADYETYREDSLWKTALYRLQEAAGLSTF